MPADSFESPLTLAACGGHVELAMLLLERGANIEEVNDEGKGRFFFRKYTMAEMTSIKGSFLALGARSQSWKLNNL